MKLDTLKAVARDSPVTIWDMEFTSAYRPPFPFDAYGSPTEYDPGSVCAMEAVGIAMGMDKRDDPPGVHPILATLVKAINDGISEAKVRTETLWPLLPKVIGTGFRYRNWEIDIYQMTVDRRLSNLEYTAILSTMSAEHIAINLKEDLTERGKGIADWRAFLDFAIRGYWSSAKQAPQADWTQEQYGRLVDLVEGVKVVA